MNLTPEKTRKTAARRSFLFSALAALLPVTCEAAAGPVATRHDWLTMKDGARLSVTYFEPLKSAPEERFPVLFELLPYRKDDSFFTRDYPLYAYFVRHGYVIAKVDVRGTGSSEGALPEREYSDQELDDAVQIIDQLAHSPFSNGNVGMWGISWSGFNAILTAMRRPPGLKAILAVDSSDDLYHDDVHFIDGAFHVDSYELSIDHENALPRSDGYKVDDAYFRDRFDREPWFLAYHRHQRDSDFWRKKSIRWDYGAIQVPTYLIGGLLDGYRDSVPRMLGQMKVPMKAEVGPWNHAWPDNGEPGPNYEWRHELVRWWDHWLKGKDTGIDKDLQRGHRFAVFVREGHPPDPALKQTPGHWRYEDWPIARTNWKRFHLGPGHELAMTPSRAEMDTLKYVPSSGVVAGAWWGEPTGDMRSADAGALVYDSSVLAHKLEIIGFPKVRLRASVDAPMADFVARLEDVAPDGRVALVTGAVLNGSQRDSRLGPKALVPGRFEDLDFDLHFTTWTFQPGHRIRIAVSNAQFPMIWPTPYPMTMKLRLGRGGSAVDLPVIPFEKRSVPDFIPPERREETPGAKELGERSTNRSTVDLDTGSAFVEMDWASGFEIGQRRYQSELRNEYSTNDEKPGQSGYRGIGLYRIEEGKRQLELLTTLDVSSDEKNFNVRFKRSLRENGKLVREREWDRDIPRDFQ